MPVLQQLSNDFRQRCEAIAVEQRYRLKLKAYDPLPAAILATALNATLFAPEQLPNADPALLEKLLSGAGWSAAIIQLNPLCILYNPTHSPGRQESNLMHELAHVLLEHKMGSITIERGKLNYSEIQEQEATFLGGCLQITRRGLLWAVQGNMTCCQIAEYFGASKHMVQFRSNATGIKTKRG